MSDAPMTLREKEASLFLILAVFLWFAVGMSLLLTALEPYAHELKQPCTEQTK